MGEEAQMLEPEIGVRCAPDFTARLQPRLLLPLLNTQHVLSRAGSPGIRLLSVPLEREMLETSPGHHGVPHPHPQYMSPCPQHPGLGLESQES